MTINTPSRPLDRPFTKEEAGDLLEMVDEMHSWIQGARDMGQGDQTIAFSLIARFGLSLGYYEELANSGWCQPKLLADYEVRHACDDCEFSTIHIDKADDHQRRVGHVVRFVR